MTETQGSPATALLARKGLAVPVGAASNAAQAPAPAPGSESLPEVAAPARAGAAPPASLLPLDFLAGRPGAGGLAPRPPDPPEAAVAPASVPASVPMAAPKAKGAAEPAAPPRTEAKLAPGGAAVPERAVKPEVPRPDPAWRIDAGAGPAARDEPRRFPALAAGLALALALGAAGYGYQDGWFVSQPPERPQTPAASAGLAPAPVQPEATDTVLAPAGATPEARSGTPAESPAAVPSVPASDQPREAVQPAVPEQPSVDVVRIEPDGAAVIAGRAAPGTELIVLDNGAPIGTVAANADGEWVLIPDSPLPRGAHDFGLVIKEVRGGVRVPAPGQSPAKQEATPEAAPEATGPGVPGKNKPGTVAGAAATVPIPPRKPDTGTKHAVGKRAVGAPPPAFVVQLASVKSRTGARREWRALRKRFPEILSRLSLSLDEAKLSGGATVVRLRIGAFPKQAEAAALCARLAAKHQDCLVVRTVANDR